MSRIYVFGDEAGNFDFSRKPGATRYFMIGTVTVSDLSLGSDLLSLRRELAWKGLALDTSFHASEDAQAVRDEVFRVLQTATFRFDITIFDKCKTLPRLQADEERFYKLAWFLHFKYVAPRITRSADDLLVVAASRGTRKLRQAIRLGIADVVDQSAVCSKWETAFWPVESDPCLQAADYCTWAVQRKLERGDDRSYVLVQHKISSEFEAFGRSATTYY